jgi:hypothetical protein
MILNIATKPNGAQHPTLQNKTNNQLKLIIMNTKHTQGEWVVSSRQPEKNNSGVYGIDIDEFFTHGIATVWGNGDGIDDEAEANAKLIAAAPELLEALKNLLKSHRQLSFDANHNLNDTPIEQMAYLAIKKATK